MKTTGTFQGYSRHRYDLSGRKGSALLLLQECNEAPHSMIIEGVLQLGKEGLE
jgi:hypothetical protein